MSGSPVSRATAYRYLAEGIEVLADQAPDLHAALTRVAEDGWSHVILDGKLFATDRLAETTTSVKGETIHAWYSGKHRRFGANVQAVIRPDGLPIWTSDASPCTHKLPDRPQIAPRENAGIGEEDSGRLTPANLHGPEQHPDGDPCRTGGAATDGDHAGSPARSPSPCATHIRRARGATKALLRRGPPPPPIRPRRPTGHTRTSTWSRDLRRRSGTTQSSAG